jgi:putative selenium metabolism protein SsnA
MIVYTNGVIITNDDENRIIQDGAITVNAGHIQAVDQSSRIAVPSDVHSVDLGGRIVMPGQILAHTHLYSYLARGLAPDMIPHTFVEQLKAMWWRLDEALSLDDVYWSAKGACIDALKSGTTTVIDHHASPSCIEGSLEACARAISEIGVRGALAYEVTDRHGMENALIGIEENIRAAELVKDTSGLLSARMGLHASFTLSDKTLDHVAEAPRLGIHVHVAEDAADVSLTRDEYGTGIIERFAKRSLLDENTILVHGVYLEDTELEMIADSGAFLVHNPRSNMNNGVGVANLEIYLERGINLAIGSDGMGPDPSDDALAAILLQRHRVGDPSPAWGLIQDMYCTGNPAIAKQTFGIPLGRIAKGFAADFVVRDYFPPTPLTPANWWAHLLFGLNRAPIHLVVVDGDELIREGRMVHIDEARVSHECRNRAKSIWNRW